ncbi:TrmH family RNA methyltransferase [Aestuariivirga litoralis]|uniref:TrmH family RNA methyltransferase n=1 Tax=Aestuariivirga litoralis TaxID=2650924 RepID=UPI0018C54114|nr:RNA methyltransferase [Aestuariivirga litoralis]MBG1231172.1 RNA methyltransferase [Aestuariivirga litoralis]
MLPISSAQNPTIKLIRSLADKKGRRDAGLFVAEGLQMLERAEALGWQPAYLISTKPIHMFDDIKPFIVTEKLMAELSAQNNPHDVLAAFPQRWQPHPSKEGNWLALEEIRDPGNLGTIIRTADAAQMAGIILVGDCCDPYAGECVRASTGSVFALPLTRMPQQSFVDFLGGWPGESVATRMDASQDFRRSYKAPTLMVLGSESRGLSDSVSKACKTKVRIPMKAGVESLNVGAAAALMLYQLAK